MVSVNKTRLLSQADRLLGRTATAVAVAAGAGVLGITPTAQAGIVYSNTVIPIPVNLDGVYLNVITGLTGTAGSGTAGWDINPYSATTLQWFQPNTTNHGFITNLGSSATLVDNLAIGSLIDVSSTFGSGTAGSEATGATAFNLNSSNNFVGFRFLNEGTSQINYGWVQVALGATFTDPARSIVGWAYEDSGAGITVTPVPEPSSMALLSVGAAGLVAYRRRRQAAKA
ncbi:MAG: PEP-CTERM sorting domain-containing protein [Gemmataceae bacterium]|nr:PEP-CTERM sorting domain-containing protein [Gemmataceae bacterium]